MKKRICTLIMSVLSLASVKVTASPLVYQGEDGLGKGKHIVFIANDHEYRSEESCPLLARSLAKHQGFKCTVLFGVDKGGNIKPGAPNIPHLDVLEDADLVVFFTRFLNLPSEQVECIANYLERGGPVVGLRTSTHSFNDQKGGWEKFNYKNKSDDYKGGFGQQILGCTWDKTKGQSHYGGNHREGGTVTTIDSARGHAIMTGVKPFHAYSGAYKSIPPVGATPLVEIQVLNTFAPSDDINKTKPKVIAGWTRDSYTAPSGESKDARVVYSSFGASEDLLDANLRRYLVNGCIWAVGLEEEITDELKVDVVGDYDPSAYSTSRFYRLGVKPSDLAGFDSAIMPKEALYAGISKKPSDKLSKVLAHRPALGEKIKALHPEAMISVK